MEQIRVGELRVDVRSESVVSGDLARVIVYQNGQKVVEVVGKVKFARGADGGIYPYVSFEVKKTGII